MQIYVKRDLGNQFVKGVIEFEDSMILTCLRSGIEAKIKENNIRLEISRECDDIGMMIEASQEIRRLEEYLQESGIEKYLEL